MTLLETLIVEITKQSVGKHGVDLATIDVHADAIVKLAKAIADKAENN